MKKRISFILIAVMLLPAFCIMKAGATVTASDEVACRLERLKNLYPTGTAQEEFYNDFIYDWETDTMSLGYKDLSGWGSWECMAWGCKVYDTLWGQSISTGQTLTDVSYICIGDYVRFNSTAQYDHSIVITDIDGNKLYYTDCNGSGYSGKIKWDRTITKSDLQTKVNKKLVMSSGYGYIRHQSGNEYKSFNVSELFNISFDANGGELDKSSKYQFCADAVNEGRGEDMIIIYTDAEETYILVGAFYRDAADGVPLSVEGSKETVCQAFTYRCPHLAAHVKVGIQFVGLAIADVLASIYQLGQTCQLGFVLDGDGGAADRRELRGIVALVGPVGKAVSGGDDGVRRTLREVVVALLVRRQFGLAVKDFHVVPDFRIRHVELHIAVRDGVVLSVDEVGIVVC